MTGTRLRTLTALAVAITAGMSMCAQAFGSRGRAQAAHAACSGPNAAHVACRFSTPAGDIHCLWTPSSKAVECELLSSGRAYRLRPSGHARAVGVKLKSRGETLPTTQQIVFPEALSCHDTRTTITCNQDFGVGEFTLGPHHSHAAVAVRGRPSA